MLARTLRRALLETRSPLAPSPSQAHSLSQSRKAPISTPSTASLSTVSPPPAYMPTATPSSPSSSSPSPSLSPSPSPLPPAPSTITVDAPALKLRSLLPAKPLELSPSVRQLLPILRSQGPHYITLHIHGNPYLVTQGDSIRLPFYMHGVEPGDVLRLDRAINLGSRDFTMKPPAPPPKRKSATTTSSNIVDPTDTAPLPVDSLKFYGAPTSSVPHYIPHLAKERYSYIDPRLFVCRATVTGVESEPMRIKEKTKRRQRHIRRVKSKHRYTIIKIKELRIRSVEEAESASE